MKHEMKEIGKQVKKEFKNSKKFFKTMAQPDTISCVLQLIAQSAEALDSDKGRALVGKFFTMCGKMTDFYGDTIYKFMKDLDKVSKIAEEIAKEAEKFANSPACNKVVQIAELISTKFEGAN